MGARRTIQKSLSKAAGTAGAYGAYGAMRAGQAVTSMKNAVKAKATSAKNFLKSAGDSVVRKQRFSSMNSNIKSRTKYRDAGKKSLNKVKQSSSDAASRMAALKTKEDLLRRNLNYNFTGPAPAKTSRSMRASAPRSIYIQPTQAVPIPTADAVAAPNRRPTRRNSRKLKKE